MTLRSIGSIDPTCPDVRIPKTRFLFLCSSPRRPILLHPRTHCFALGGAHSLSATTTMGSNAVGVSIGGACSAPQIRERCIDCVHLISSFRQPHFCASAGVGLQIERFCQWTSKVWMLPLIGALRLLGEWLPPLRGYTRLPHGQRSPILHHGSQHCA